MLHCLFLLFSTMVGDSFEDSIKPIRSTVNTFEGSNVSLSCNYTGTAGLTKYLHWYRQYPRSKLEFIILIMEKGVGGNTMDQRFTVKIDESNKRVDLELSSAEVTDSALYYCALQPTVTGNPYTLYKNLTPPRD
ncbi:hypothetical protein AAFF_G00401710 [Aldrovandia affinis]|uniref:Ig-like domain-containing protein n=1 Tax=Aldrovandia affinis TaxID=143900 RepID=A0AAD7R3V7_9TELE|nr:hypothetical protein AAFF_G00401710 [Aldrovandia affinis]